jgi:hypothetical protein
MYFHFCVTQKQFGMNYVLCFMLFYVLCCFMFVYVVLCFMFVYVGLCFMFYVLCFMLVYVGLCFMFYVLWFILGVCVFNIRHICENMNYMQNLFVIIHFFNRFRCWHIYITWHHFGCLHTNDMQNVLGYLFVDAIIIFYTYHFLYTYI